MQSRRTFIVSAAAVLAELRAFAQPLRWTTDSAIGTIASLQQGLIAASRSASIDERFRTLEPLIAATHDLPYIAEFALRRLWSTLAEADRRRFVAAFERLSVMTYAARFKAVGADAFRPVKAEPADAQGDAALGELCVARSKGRTSTRSTIFRCTPAAIASVPYRELNE